MKETSVAHKPKHGRVALGQTDSHVLATVNATKKKIPPPPPVKQAVVQQENVIHFGNMVIHSCSAVKKSFTNLQGLNARYIISFDHDILSMCSLPSTCTFLLLVGLSLSSCVVCPGLVLLILKLLKNLLRSVYSVLCLHFVSTPPLV